jgi:two-component system OmpR family sensor kinase
VTRGMRVDPVRPPQDFRRRFILGGIGLILFAGLLIGFASTATVARQLLGDLDRDLFQASARLTDVADNSLPRGMEGARGRLDRPGFDVGTLIAVVGPNQVAGAFIDTDGQLKPIADEDLSELQQVSWPEGTPVSVHLEGGFHEVRTLLVGGVGDSQIVIGLPMNEIRETITRLTVVIFLVVALVVVLAAAIGFWGIRFALRPLDRMRQTAQAVSNQSLSDREARLLERVPESLANPDTEIGQLGASFNHMLDHVDASLVARAKSEEKLRHFVADASHELRTPLASIRGYSEITLRQGEKLPEEVQQSLSRIESESIRMSHLVEDLLLLARLDEGQTAEMEPVDFGDVVSNVLSDAKVRAPGHNWSAKIPKRPVMVRGNRNQLVQVITNLAQNASIHTPGGTNVSLELKKTADAVELLVRDNGPGIAPELQPELFERFRRADKGRSRAKGSTGLGLAIVQGIVESHGGSVSVESAPGKTVFRVHLPQAN